MLGILTSWLGLLLVGAAAGIASGLFGIGGGLIMVPIFTLILKMEAKNATATSLAVVLLPVALPAVLRFQKAGHIDWRVVLWVALGFALSSQVGARLNLGMSEVGLRRIFAVLLVLSAIQMAFKAPKSAAAPASPPPSAPSAR